MRGRRDHRPAHAYDWPVIGPVHTAEFKQVLSGERRTVQIVRFAECDAWKVRMVETHSVLSRLREQVEFDDPYEGRIEITRYLRGFGLHLVGSWKERYPAGLERSREVAPGVMIQ